MSRLSTIIDESVGSPEDWLDNPHAGEMLKSEFLGPLGLTAADLALCINVAEPRVRDVIEGRQRIDADLDLRLARYFRMSAGFFLGLQADYELLEAKRTLNGELDHIVPRSV